MKPRFLSILALAGCSVFAQSPALLRAVQGEVDKAYPELEPLYLDLHQHPELSGKEVETARKLAEHLRTLGFDVTTGVGGTGVVGVLHNGPGPVLLIRTELDALPVVEKTGLPYASLVPGVMQACGHDVHMTAWTGGATILSRMKDRWHGTLLMIGQPAEETVSGAKAMIADGLFTRFPKPTFALAMHDAADLPAGQVAWVEGYFSSNVDSVDITLFGKGGHGAHPNTTVDPIVMAARTIMALQTIVSREKDPLRPGVVTVGSIHGGSKHNIIPDEVKLQLTVRSFSPAVRKQLLEAITRITKAEAVASGAPREPLIAFSQAQDAGWNDPVLTRRVAGALRTGLGAERVVPDDPTMGSEDFGEFAKAAGIPSVYLSLGAVEPGRFKAAQASGESLPSLHSSLFAPDRERTIRTGMDVLVLSAMELLGPSGQP